MIKSAAEQHNLSMGCQNFLWFPKITNVNAAKGKISQNVRIKWICDIGMLVPPQWLKKVLCKDELISNAVNMLISC